MFRLRRCLGVMPPRARRSCESGRLQGLNDEQWPGRPRTVTDEQVEKMITATLEQEPPAGTRTNLERWSAEFTNRKLRRSVDRSVTELETDIRKWINEWNKDPRLFVWTKTADEILETLATYCERIIGSGH